MIDKLPPTNLEAEEAILGGILLDPLAISRVCDYLVPDAFYISSHNEIYQALLRLHHNGKPTDLLTVIDWLKDHDLLMKIGGRNKLVSLLERTVSAVSNEQIHTNTEHNSAIAYYAYTDLESNKPIYPTGLKELDKLIIGFEPGTLNIVAGRPSMGKSMIAMNLALGTIQNYNLPVVIFSLEMSKIQLEYRLWSTISVHKEYESLLTKPIGLDRVRRHRSGLNPLSDKEFASIAKIASVCGDLPLYINDSRGITVAGITSECRQFQARDGRLGLVIVYYLQLMALVT